MKNRIYYEHHARDCQEVGITKNLLQASGDDNDNDTLREVPHPSNEGLALQARVKGS